MADKLSVPEKQAQLRQRRSTAEKVYRKADPKKLKAGAGKGLEPKPWCECHNRNPCPIAEELAA